MEHLKKKRYIKSFVITSLLCWLIFDKELQQDLSKFFAYFFEKIFPVLISCSLAYFLNRSPSRKNIKKHIEYLGIVTLGILYIFLGGISLSLIITILLSKLFPIRFVFVWPVWCSFSFLILFFSFLLFFKKMSQKKEKIFTGKITAKH